MSDTATPAPRWRFRMFRVAGIDVEAHHALVPVACVLGFVFATSLLPQQEGPDAYTPLGFWLLGLGGALLLFASVLLHELAHALTARLSGAQVKRITVFFHSGSNDAERPRSAGWELLVAASGPAVTLTLILTGALGVTALAEVRYAAPLSRLLLITNVLFGLCHLLPGLPLDGGRLVRAAFWAMTGNLLEATRWACIVARIFAVVLGLASILILPRIGFPSAWVWGGLLAMILWLQAGTTWRLTKQNEQLSGLKASDLLEPAPEPLSRVMSVADALSGLLADDAPVPRAFLVEWSGRLGGIVTLSALRRVSEDERDSTPVGQVTRRLRWEHVLSPSTALNIAFDRMTKEHLPVLPVVDEDRVLGIVSHAAVAQVIEEGLPARS